MERKDGELLKDFGNLALSMFKDVLAPYGFRRESKKTEKYFCKIIFVHGERYVKISANIHPRDYPPHFNIVLGEGSREAIESDWNSIALWRLKNFITSTNTSCEYSLDPTNFLDSLERAKEELLEFGREFLSGDVAQFHQARSEQNKNREPYKIFCNGAVSDESKSLSMKRKYS